MGIEGPGTTSLLLISIAIAYSNLVPGAGTWWVWNRSESENAALSILFFTPVFVAPLVLLGVLIYLGVQEAVTWWRIVWVALEAALLTSVGSLWVFWVSTEPVP